MGQPPYGQEPPHEQPYGQPHGYGQQVPPGQPYHPQHGQQAGYGYPPPKPKGGVSGVLLVVLLAVVLLIGGGCAAFVFAFGDRDGGEPVRAADPATAFSLTPTEPPASDPSAPAEAAHEVVFEAVASDGASTAGNITYSVEFSIKQEQGVALPYNKQVTYEGEQPPLYLWVQNAGDQGTITCRIKVDGKVVREAKSNGPYGVCTVKADAP